MRPDPGNMDSRRVDLGEEFVGWAETHDVEEIRRVFNEDLDPNAEIRGRTPIEWMIETADRRASRLA